MAGDNPSIGRDGLTMKERAMGLEPKLPKAKKKSTKKKKASE